MQALEHARPALPVRPGKIERIEYEYIRHGTLCLTANLEIATGRIVSPTIAPRRTEEDFVDHVARTVDADPGGRWIFVLDNLNTHNSEALVRFVAARCDLHVPLGVKGRAASCTRWRRAPGSCRIPRIGSGSSTRRSTAPG
ncbi:transposase [Nannocystis pusilla]|uniref:transposase n=1 Tax=Nannocystis pusilla TaxID=889268 RepID=UPI003B7CABC0